MTLLPAPSSIWDQLSLAHHPSGTALCLDAVNKEGGRGGDLVWVTAKGGAAMEVSLLGLFAPWMGLLWGFPMVSGLG